MSISTKYMPFFCMGCKTRAPEFVIEHETGNIVEVCKCSFLFNRTTRLFQHSVLYLDGKFEVQRLVSK